MRLSTTLLLLICTVTICRAQTRGQKSVEVYPTLSYLNIKLDAAGHLPANPYVKRFKNGNKEIVFCGVNHVNKTDTGNAMYKGVETIFYEFKPDVCVNEGGDMTGKHFATNTAAILKSGEIGLTKFLADSLRIPCINGDMPDSAEFKELLKHYTKGEFLAYIGTERCMWSINPNDSATLAQRYSKFINSYILKEGVTLNAEEQSLDFFKANYKQLLNRPFSLETLEPTNPFEPKGKFQQIGRRSKEIRDQALLQKIDSLINKHNKVFVVFGGWHLLTCQPGLQQIIAKKR